MVKLINVVKHLFALCLSKHLTNRPLNMMIEAIIFATNMSIAPEFHVAKYKTDVVTQYDKLQPVYCFR